jgi:hypothetical protein
MKLSDEEYSSVRLYILRKLTIHGYIGARHTSIDNLQKGLPGKLRGEARGVAKDLIKEGLLLIHPTSYGDQVALNPRAMDRIKELLKADDSSLKL